MHDPVDAETIKKCGKRGNTDNEGFDPDAVTVGPGIYGGIVKRDPETGEVIIGEQYQNHNPRPGPVYAGGGYTPMNNAIRKGRDTLKPLLDKYPDLVNEITTGGAQPLHMCGMGGDSQHSTAYLIMRGANIEAIDTYGFTPLHRMASNNLAVGAMALLDAGADPESLGGMNTTPLQIAQESEAAGVIRVLQKHIDKKNTPVPRSQVRVTGAGTDSVNHVYTEKNPKVIPVGFSITCVEKEWDPEKTWVQLSDQKTPWFGAPNGAYIYFNQSDGQWWIDAPDGHGVYVVEAPATKPPDDGWSLLPGAEDPAPRVELL